MYVEQHNPELCFGNTSRLFLKFTYTQDNMLSCGINMESQSNRPDICSAIGSLKS